MRSPVAILRLLGEHALRATDPTEAEAVAFISEFVRAHTDALHRSQLLGHLTGSAWIVDAARTRALLTHHRKLDKWLQPGGHADGDPDLRAVAMRERKQTMEERADAFVALPGGWGTLEEVMEILVLRQLQRHKKPTVFLNHAGYYDHLLAFLEHMISERFGRTATRACFAVRDTPAGVLDYLDDYKPTESEQPWFQTR
jgi:hypothetical protein